MATEAPAVLITGAGRGIGKALALGFAGAGYRVAVGSPTMSRNEAVAAAIADQGGQALPFALDVADEARVADAMAQIVQTFGRLDVLVNNAALKPAFVGPDERRLQDLTLATWNRVLAVNLTGAFLCARAAVNLMGPQGGGSIISVSTLSAVTPRESEPVYAVTKAALNMLTRVLAMETAPHGIAVNAMAVSYTVSDDDPRQRTLAPEQKARAMRPAAWVPLALHLARRRPAEGTGEVIDAQEWNVAHGHGGREVWSWGASAG
jgi:NAD(P)-dependent dehydrogenase (short-subunit alcohol dehydrogenase family)